MSITFHCEHCGKKIEAQDSAGGKWGKCPACRNKVYVPDLSAEEDLKLAPVDETEEQRRKRLTAEAYEVTQDILREREVPDSAAESFMPLPQISSEELEKKIVTYLRQMADGNLGEAEQTARLILPFGMRALEILDRIAVSEMPERELADIPQQVLSGLIRNLREQVG
jgi:cytochrome c1